MAEETLREQIVQQELERFCNQITGHPSMLCFFAGSSVEIPEPPTNSAQSDLGISSEHCDIDMMYYAAHICALPQHEPVPEAYAGEIKRICTYGVHTGYARLIGDRDCEERGVHADFVNISKFGTISNSHGPAVQADFNKMFIEAFSRYGLDLLYYFQCASMDSVFSVHSPIWPDQASEWVTRECRQGFPSKSLVERVTRYGCDLVKTSPKNNICGRDIWNDDVGKTMHWRFSFSMAEYLIIRNWSISQRIVYRTLRSLHKIIISNRGSSNLCTYYFKTLMLWECERKDTEFWSEATLLSSVCLLLNEMIQCLENKCCPNYFIRDNNMMDHLHDTEIIGDVDGLRDILKQDDKIHEVLKRSEDNEMLTMQAQYQIEWPNWLYRCSLMFAYVLNSAFPMIELFSATNLSKLRNALHKELYDVCQGLCLQREAVTCTSKTKTERYLLDARRHLEKSTHLYDSADIVFIDLSNDPLLATRLAWIFKFIKLRNTPHGPYPQDSDLESLHPEFVTRAKEWDSNNMRKRRDAHKCLVYARSLEPPTRVNNREKEQIPKTNVEEIRLYSVFHNKETACISYSEGFFPNLPGFMATVSLSWFVAKAYLANLMYTTVRDEAYVQCSKCSMKYLWFTNSL